MKALFDTNIVLDVALNRPQLAARGFCPARRQILNRRHPRPMRDIFPKRKRSEVMSRIRGAGNKTTDVSRQMLRLQLRTYRLKLTQLQPRPRAGCLR